MEINIPNVDVKPDGWKEFVCVFDTETTSLLAPEVVNSERQPRVWEFSGILAMVSSDGHVDELTRLDMMFNPGVKLDPKVVKLTGMIDDKLTDKPTFKLQSQFIIDFMRGIPILNRHLGLPTLVAHNLNFDLSILDIEMQRAYNMQPPWKSWRAPNQKTVCTVENTEHIYGTRISLTNLFKDLTGNDRVVSHRGMADVEVLLQCYAILRKRGQI